MVSGGRKDSQDRELLGLQGHPLVCVPAAHWDADPLGCFGSLLHAVDVLLNPGIAGIGTDMPAPFGEKDNTTVEALVAGLKIGSHKSAGDLPGCVGHAAGGCNVSSFCWEQGQQELFRSTGKPQRVRKKYREEA